MTSDQNANDLFVSAGKSGVLSQTSVRALTVVDQNDELQKALGLDVDNIPYAEALLVSILLDDSSSIEDRRNTQAIIDGYNLVLNAVNKSKQQDNVYVHCQTLNKGALYPFRQIGTAPRLDGRTYRPCGQTPLYDQTFRLLKATFAEMELAGQQGIVARSIVLIVTDGADVGSSLYTPADVCSLVKDMLRQETSIVMAMGISDGYTDFRQVFQGMGIPSNLILTPGNSESEIREKFQVASVTAVRASQNAASFSQTALGGFGA